MEMEQWAVIPGASGRYEASSAGRIRSLIGSAPRVLKANLTSSGYLSLALSRSPGISKSETVHSLVAQAFLGPRPGGADVRHLDGNRRNNHVSNLAYGTRSENIQDSVRHGTHPQASKTHCKQRHEYSQENTGGSPRARQCKTCLHQQYLNRKTRQGS